MNRHRDPMDTIMIIMMIVLAILVCFHAVEVIARLIVALDQAGLLASTQAWWRG